MEREVEGWAYFRFPEQAVVQLYFLRLTYMPWQSQTVLPCPRTWWVWVSSALPEIVPSASCDWALPQPHPLRSVTMLGTVTPFDVSVTPVLLSRST